MKLKQIIKIIFFTLFLNSIFFAASANPNIYTNIKIPDEIKFKLDNSNYNKYLKRGMRAYVDGEIDGSKNIEKKYKKWAEAKIVLEDKELISKIRILGDWKDHIELPLTSLKVKVEEGSFYGITRFNLFLPKTRRSENEIFWTLMLSYINYPTLFTKMVEVNLNGNIYKAIFQEDASKEFLERNKITETPILKKNDFIFYLNEFSHKVYQTNFSSSFVIDNGNFLKNNTSYAIASEAISLISSDNFKSRIIRGDFFEQIHKKYGQHALDDINRKYIYIPYRKMFMPLYYDGMIKFHSTFTNCSREIDKEVMQEFEVHYKKLSKAKISSIQRCVFKNIYSQHIEYSLNKQNEPFVYNANLPSNFYKPYLEIKNQIIEHLKENKPTNTKSSNGITYISSLNNKFYKCLKNLDLNKISSCSVISENEYKKFISESGRSKKVNQFISFPINLGSLDEIDKFEILKLNQYENKKIILDKPIAYIIHNIETDNKKYEFVFKNHNARLLISGNLKDSTLIFSGEYEKKYFADSKVRYDKNLLTGCTTFLKSNFKNVNIIASNMICEDAINIKDSNGKLNNVEIFNSAYDAIDIDFSKILFKKIFVSGSDNDCVDFSFGEYKIENLNADFCGDKAVSVGEKSKVFINEAKIKNSNTGVASKDSSDTELNNIELKNLKICLSAYNKKPEFSGAVLKVNNLKCNNYVKKFDIDQYSKINISNEN